MEQTFYIEADEEIISVISRMRKSSSQENIFVFPKRALVLQSIINLRLLQREAQKLGKKIILVTQDEAGRLLAEKAGIETENYSEDFAQKTSHLELSSKDISPEITSTHDSGEEETVSGNIGLRSEGIGSADFYNGPTTTQTVVTKAPEEKGVETLSMTAPKTVRVRDATPKKLTSLNSQRVDDMMGSQVKRQARVVEKPLPSAQALTESSPTRVPSTSISRDERLRNFYSNTYQPASPEKKKEQPKMPEEQVPSLAGKKAHYIFFILGGISLLSTIGVLVYLFLPKAEIHVTPYRIMQNVDMEFEGRTDMTTGEKVIPARVFEKEKELALTVPTTGKSGGNNQKASGTVILSNNYSAEPQSLVATTRLETGDGKIYRLVKGVTVPGMVTSNGKKEAGMIEAEVIADQAGEEYNITPSTFTIPGFKGGPKYEAFSAKSSKAMLGGGSGGTDVAVIAKVDLETAERDAKESARNAFLEEIRGELLPGEKILDEHIEIVPTVLVSPLQIGTAASSFEYRNTFRVKAFVFSEKALQEKIETEQKKTIENVSFKVVSSAVTYGDSVPNFSENTLRLRARALLTLESEIDEQALRGALAGASIRDIENVLSQFPSVKKINVIFRPDLFVQSIPDAEKRIVLIVEKGEEEK
ncbi:MAG: hypothetical protein HYV45_03790 [Candidatus Moranbacteria bacterium]|nr:hypothetical protein [Candidatus Moranbacteria bacterium]